MLNPGTNTVERRVAVGAVPVDFAVHPVTGDVWVLNGGDMSISIVHPDNQVETVPLSGYGERSPSNRPNNILLDPERNQFYITDAYNKVFVYNLATRKEIKQIVTGPALVGPRVMAIIGGELHVVTTNADQTQGGVGGASVVVVNREALTVTRSIYGLGFFPNAIVAYPEPQ